MKTLHITGRFATIECSYHDGNLKGLKMLRGNLTPSVWARIQRYIPHNLDQLEEFSKRTDSLTYAMYVGKSSTQSAYKEFVEVWFDFYQRINGHVPDFKGTDGRALKQLIAYFQKLHPGDDLAALGTWKALLGQWKHLPEFYRKKTDIVFINAKINEIITHLKDEQSNSSQAHRDADDLRRGK